MSEVEKIAAGLTKARIAMILALPADGRWGPVPSRSVAKRAWWGMMPPLIDHKHCPEDANEWALTAVGRRVRAHLQPKDPAQ
jgi:hypothetical protein